MYNNCHTKSFVLSQGVKQGSLLSPYLYNFYTEDLLKQIKSMNIGTFIGDINTSIIVYADDIILISPTLKSLQKLVDGCVKYGLDLGLKFNHQKTQLCTSGSCQIASPHLSMYDKKIVPKDRLEHLGFKWQLKNNTLQLNFHKDMRLAEMWSVTSTLISAGVRNTHPKIITNLFNTVVIPKLLYGMEILRLSSSDIAHLEAQARSSLKALLGVSKHSRNLVNRIFKIPEIGQLIEKRQMLLINQLLQNATLRKHLLYIASLNSVERSFSTLSFIFDRYISNDIDIVDGLLGKVDKFPIVYTKEPDNPEITLCKNHLENWHLLEHRLAFKSLLEERIQRGNLTE